MKFEKFYQGTSVNRWERLRNYPRPHAVPSLLDHWTARTKKWPFKLKLTAWNKCDGAERTQVTLWFLFTYQSVLFHTYIFFSFALLEMYFLRQWLRAKLGYQTKLCDSFGKWIQKSRSPKVQSSLIFCLVTCNGCQTVSGSHSSSHSSMTPEQKKKKEKDGWIKSELRI